MNKVGVRKTVFVCANIVNNNLLTKVIQAETSEEASKIFNQEFLINPKEVLGPFYKKRIKVVEQVRTLKFSNETKKALYNNWVVNAMLLKEPEDHAFLIFIKSNDDQKRPFPKGTVIVHISELRYI